MKKSLVAIGSLGGTVSMTADASSSGILPRLNADDLVRSIPILGELADIRAEALFKLPSGSLGFDHLLKCLAWARAQVEQGAEAVVFTQGTDTLEEAAFFFDLLWDRPEPLILTGAMRSPNQVGADGPANLLAAVVVAVAPASRGRGAQVVMNDVVHEARWVRKCHTLATDAFESWAVGAAGFVIEGHVQYVRPIPARNVLQTPESIFAQVFLLEACLGDGGEMIDLVQQAGYQGVVVSGFGAGHVSFAMADRLGHIAQHIPVVVGSRTGAGTTAFNTYGYIGAEIDLMKRGVLMAGWLCPRKARVLLCCLLSVGASLDQCREVLNSWGQVQN